MIFYFLKIRKFFGALNNIWSHFIVQLSISKATRVRDIIELFEKYFRLWSFSSGILRSSNNLFQSVIHEFGNMWITREQFWTNTMSWLIIIIQSTPRQLFFILECECGTSTIIGLIKQLIGSLWWKQNAGILGAKSFYRYRLRSNCRI